MKCLVCERDGELIEVMQHSALADYRYKCQCGAEWTLIKEGERKHRFQLCYPKEVLNDKV